MTVETRGRIRRLLMAGFVLFGTLAGMLLGSRIASTASNAYEKLDLFSDVLSTVQNSYVDEVDVDELIYGAIDGMMSTLDPHSSFLDPDGYKEMQVDTTGAFGGLGIEVSLRDGTLLVVSPIEDTPASRAGIQAEDRILAIDDKSTQEMSLMDAVKHMRGPAGSEVTISVLRDGWNGPRDFTLEREVIRIKSVKSSRLSGDIGHVRLTQFQEKTVDDLRRALTELEKKPLAGLVLDLRNNPGGLLDQAILVTDEFIDEGLIVYTEGRLPNSRQEFRARREARKRQYPIVVLVNGGSASASEIVAGALQDHQRAMIMGTTTFGKGSVQTIVPLRDGSALRLTTAKYFTPAGRSIQATGIEPDIIVPQAVVTDSPTNHMVLREKDLEHHFENGEAEGEEADTEETDTEAAPPAGPAVSGEFEDYQLSRAADLLRGLKLIQTQQQKSVK